MRLAVRFLAVAVLSVAQGCSSDSTDPAPQGCPAGFADCAGSCAAIRIDPDNCGECGTTCGANQICRGAACSTVCPAGQALCGGACVQTSTDPANCGACGAACGDGQVCAAGGCAVSCSAGLTRCGDVCVDARTDDGNCGLCGAVCGAGQRCVAGACVTACPAGQTLCAGSCVSTQLDPANCGACGTVCGAAQTCAAGECLTSCPAGQTLCDGACVGTETDPAHCGDCATACGAAQACVGGACTTTCPAGQTLCDGACVGTETDPTHCGDCATACTPTQACLGGTCTTVCPAGLALCDAACTDTDLDAANCGACGAACGAGQICQAGTCATVCPAGQTLCGGACVTTRTDPTNCGGCGVTCGAGQVCTGSACADACPPGGIACAGTCVNPLADPANCGGCGNACADGQACAGGACAPSCEASLRAGITDPWGIGWDGLERPPAALATASAACSAIGGRLPTATELFRVSLPQSGAVGQPYTTSYLWTAIAQSPANQFVGRLSDGATSTSAIVSPGAYRCVCAPPPPATFTEGNCNGPAGAACSALDAGTNVDALDRVALSLGGAMQECALARGRVAEWRDLAERLPGLPNGSGNWLHTADLGRYNYDIFLRWTGTGTGWVPDVNSTVGATTDLRPFRCVGPSRPLVAPVAPVGSFRPPAGGLAGDVADFPTAQWALAHDACIARGGHLPRAAELGALVQQGLPNGSPASLWTADMEGYNGTQFLAATLVWSGTATRLAFSYPTDLSWAYQSPGATAPHRCVYAPTDGAFTAPAACSGGCFAVTVNAQATLWMDAVDRSPASLGAALTSCAAAGGHLAMVRDYVEAVRKSLPNGSFAWLWTADAAYGEFAMNVQSVRWSAAQPAFDASYSTYLSWMPLGGTAPYRCAWTNEVR